MAADIIGALAWPAVVALIVILFGKDVVRVVRSLASRAEGVKVGVAGVSLDLSLARRVDDQATRSVQNVLAVAGGGAVGGSGVLDLYRYFNAASTDADYVVVDLGGGQSWLSSRLYLLAVLAARQRNVHQMVFVRDRDYPGVFFGTASVESVARALVFSEPDLEAAMAWALYAIHQQGGGPTVTPGVPFNVVYPARPPSPIRNFELGANAKFMSDAPLNNLVMTYLAVLRGGDAPPAPPPPGWVAVSDGVENASWMEPARLGRLLGLELHTDRALWKSKDALEAEPGESPWVALVDLDGRFQQLAKRRPVTRTVDQTSERLKETSA